MMPDPITQATEDAHVALARLYAVTRAAVNKEQRQAAWLAWQRVNLEIGRRVFDAAYPPPPIPAPKPIPANWPKPQPVKRDYLGADLADHGGRYGHVSLD